MAEHRTGAGLLMADHKARNTLFQGAVARTACSLKNSKDFTLAPQN